MKARITIESAKLLRRVNMLLGGTLGLAMLLPATAHADALTDKREECFAAVRKMPSKSKPEREAKAAADKKCKDDYKTAYDKRKADAAAAEVAKWNYTPPTWCGSPGTEGAMNAAIMQAETKLAPWEIPGRLIATVCKPHKDDETYALLPATRSAVDRWAKGAGLADKLAILVRGRDQMRPDAPSFQASIAESYSPFTQYYNSTNSSEWTEVDFMHVSPTAMGRFGAAVVCTKHANFPDDEKAKADASFASLAVCAPDLDSADRVLAQNELWSIPTAQLSDAKKVDWHLRMIREERTIKLAQKMYAEKLKGDPGLVEADKLARKTWAAWGPGGDALLLEARTWYMKTLVAQNTHKRSAVEGCETRLKAPLQKALARVNFTPTWDAAGGVAAGYGPWTDISNDPAATLLTLAYYLCVKEGIAPPSGQQNLDLDYAHALLNGRGATFDYWGPRTHAATLLLRAFGDFKFEDREIRPQRFAPWNAAPRFLGLDTTRMPSPTPSTYAIGTVASVSTGKQTTTVSFQPKMDTIEYCANWVPTSKIRRIDADGRIEYDTRCAQSVTKRVNLAPKPVEIPNNMAAGIKSGVWVQIVGFSGKIALPHFVGTGTKKGKDLTHVLGLPVR